MDLVMFAHDGFTAQAEALGVAAVLVDLEVQAKEDRQRGFDTQISVHTVADVARVRSMTNRPLICRVDRQRELDVGLLDQIIGAGADEVLLAMVRGHAEVEPVLEFVDGEVDVGIMIETSAAIAQCRELAALPLNRVFVGLNDLWVERQSRTRFDALIDGTADAVATAFAATEFGIGGATHPNLGRPLAARHLIHEIARLDADFTFLRRSFFDACQTHDPNVVVAAIKAEFAQAEERNPRQVDADRITAAAAIATLPAESRGGFS